MTIKEIQEEIVEEFAMFDDWMDKYDFLIDISKELPIIEPTEKTDSNLINGCQSKVWLHAAYENGVINFKADSDSVFTKGMVALLVRVLSGQTPKDIMDVELFFIDQIGLKENLSPTRSNGLLAMLKQMKLYALAFNQKHK